MLDLSTDDFEIVENGRTLPVAHLSLQSEPVALGLVVDRSNSIATVKNTVDEAVAQILESASPDDQASLMTFAGGDDLEIPMTKDRKGILNVIRKTKLEFGKRFYDALIDSLDQLSKTRLERKALIVFSDGADHYSWHTFEQVLAAGYPIFIVGYVGCDSLTWSSQGRRKIRNQLDQLATMTGGRTFFPSHWTECPELARQTLDILHYAYGIGF